MKALSVRQPWASLIASGRKTIELRSWNTTHRGPLLICSGGRADRLDMSTRPMRTTFCEIEDLGPLPLGVSLAIVDVVDCRLATPDDTHAACILPAPAAFAWVLSNARPVAQTPVKGKLSFFQVEGFQP